MILLMNQNELQKLLDIFINNDFLSQIFSIERLFHDEPHLFSYSAFIKKKIKKISRLNYETSTPEVYAAGVSNISPELALTKCLGEAAERICSFSYKKSSIIKSSFNELKNQGITALNPIVYTGEESIRNNRIGWTKGLEYPSNKPIMIPSQLIYLNYDCAHKEPELSPSITTGCAFHQNKKMTILNGLYEIIERDAIMTMYLARINFPRVDLESINDNNIKLINRYFHRYNLDLYTYNITNDIPVPTYITFIIDNKTDIKPALAVGAKSDFDHSNAIISSITEAYASRNSTRFNCIIKKSNDIKMSDFDNILVKRAIFWSTRNMLSKLDFLLNQPTEKIKITKQNKINTQEKLDKIINILNQKGLSIYYADINLPFFKNQYFVYKVIVPKLQPLYLGESNNPIRLKIDRLKQVVNFFGKKELIINKIPHPFL